MHLDQRIAVMIRFERRLTKAHGPGPGKGHLTVNGVELGEMWGPDAFHKKPTEEITVEQFLDDPCVPCYARMNGITKREALLILRDQGIEV